MDPVERANREAELAHELEELKVSVREREDAIHAMRNRMQVLVVRLAALRRGLEDPV
jgi:hypothetical protein